MQDYFLLWQEDAHRNALNGHCYWLLRREGLSATEATSALIGKSTSYKNELLFQHGINYDKIPAWQKRGIGVYWGTYEKTGTDLQGVRHTALRRCLKTDFDLPRGDDYAEFIAAKCRSEKSHN